jgi:hypothetical protein
MKTIKIVDLNKGIKFEEIPDKLSAYCLPILVKLTYGCANDDCNNFVETIVIVKTHTMMYEILLTEMKYGNNICSDILCPLCKKEMKLNNIQLITQNHDEFEYPQYLGE